ncbi:hypothetical protein Tco_1438753 [Tanacetum coccineum]
MDITKAEQIALDDALVAPANQLKIGKCNLRLSSDITSKEATLQVIYDVLKLTPFYKAFLVSADAPEIYMQEFWATASVHNRPPKVPKKKSQQTGRMTGSGIAEATCLGDGVDDQSKVPDEQTQKKTGTDEGADDDTNKDLDAHDDNDATKSDDDGDNITHPKLSTFTTDDQEEQNDKEEQLEDDEDEEEISN